MSFYFLIITLLFSFVFGFIYLFSSDNMSLYLKIATFNCCGLNNDAKPAAIFAHPRQLDAQVILLQEIFSKPREEETWVGKWAADQAIFNSLFQNSRTASGTVIMLNHPALVFGPIKRDIDGRVMTAEAKHNGFSVNVINIYAPVSCQSISVQEDFFQITL